MAQMSGIAVMQLLPSGLVVPPLPYLLALAVTGGAVVALLLRRRPAITQRLVAAFAPWMVAGAAMHALYQLEAVPAAIAPFVSAPTVYLTTFTLAGACWLALSATDRETPIPLAAAGTLVALLPSALVIRAGIADGTFSPVVPVVGLVASTLLAGLVVAVLGRIRPTAVERTGWLGALVVFGHTLDGVSTAIGVDLLASGERSPLPRAIMDFAGQLPTASLIGKGWLFVLVKVAIAVAVVVLFADYVENDPFWGNTALGIVTAMGLGPGAHNLLLFSAAGAL